jgi:hypothetical protein
MAPNHDAENEKMQICFPFENDQLIGHSIFQQKTQASFMSGIVFLKIESNITTNIAETVCDTYLQFLHEIVFQINAACNVIFTYTYEHLSSRCYDNISILKISVIQSNFADIYVLLEKLAILKDHIISLNDVIYFLSITIEALSILTKLAGARSVLRNKSVELTYHLKLFEKFIQESHK